MSKLIPEYKKSCENCGNNYCREESFIKYNISEKDAQFIADHCTGFVNCGLGEKYNEQRKELLNKLRKEKISIIINSIIMTSCVPTGINMMCNSEKVLASLIGLGLLSGGAMGIRGLVDSIDDYADTKNEIYTLKKSL